MNVCLSYYQLLFIMVFFICSIHTLPFLKVVWLPFPWRSVFFLLVLACLPSVSSAVCLANTFGAMLASVPNILLFCVLDLLCC